MWIMDLNTSVVNCWNGRANQALRLITSKLKSRSKTYRMNAITERFDTNGSTSTSLKLSKKPRNFLRSGSGRMEQMGIGGIIPAQKLKTAA